MKKGDLKSCLESQFLDALTGFKLVKPGERIIIALSGGPDSVFLTFLFNKYREKYDIKLLPVHINHNLRGRESLDDEAFCRKFAEGMGLKCRIHNIYPLDYAEKNSMSVETASRELRYKELESVLLETKSDKIATAHHLDDLVETMLFRLFKGTGISGLAAMSPSRDKIIRPLLFFGRRDIQEYLAFHNIPFCRDLSNQDDKYDRNYIRNRIIPQIETRFPDLNSKMLNLYRIIIEEDKLWQTYLDDLKDSYKKDGSSIIIFKDKLPLGKDYSNALLKRFFRQILIDFSKGSFHPDFLLISLLADHAGPRPGNKTLYDNGRIRIISSYGRLIIDKGVKKFPKNPKYVKLNYRTSVSYGIYSLTIEKVSGEQLKEGLKSSATSCFFRNDDLETVILRQKHEGDRFRLPKTGTKKIKDYFIDAKFSRSQREESFLLEGKEGIIIAVYVPGYGFRVSSDYYIDEDIRTALKINVSRKHD